MTHLRVTSDGYLSLGEKRFQCSPGKGGVAEKQAEGDSVTPVGVFPLREVFYRADRLSLPETMLPIQPINAQDGWCDAPEHPSYNQKISFPFDASAERLWREDHVYDVIVVIGYNDAPIVAGKGSAIFMHVAIEDYTPTEGCVALAREDLLEVLRHCDSSSMIEIVDNLSS